MVSHPPLPSKDLKKYSGLPKTNSRFCVVSQAKWCRRDWAIAFVVVVKLQLSYGNLIVQKARDIQRKFASVLWFP